MLFRSGTSPLGEPNEIRQYASSDGGCTFSLVWQSDTHATSPYEGGTYPDVVALPDGSFVAGFINHDPNPTTYRLSSAFQSIGSLTPTTIDIDAYETELVMTCDENGSLYLTTRSGSSGKWISYTSTDGGSTWVPMARSALAQGAGIWWSDGGAGNTYPESIA